MTYQYSTDKPEHMSHSIDKPIPTLTTSNAHMLVTQFLASYYGGDDTAERVYPLEDPIGTITTANRFALITQFLTRHQNSNGHPEYNIQSINDAISTLTTREKHALITQVCGDVYFRFITIDEAKKLQGFPDDYILTGSKAEQLRHIGNSVVPLVAKRLIEENMA
ncbi:MAG: DNA cytosine methyltransferase [Candidatus Paceibacterota bacterium]|jgi:DNA (cytosine-5)-methyltransferase 1